MIKMLDDIFIKTYSYNFWWGIYGLTPLTGWEDIAIFDSSETNAKRIGFTCICTKNYFENALEELKEDPDEQDYVEQINEYLKDNKIHYEYSFDNPSDDDFFELSYNNLPRNELGVKPRYIEMWHPSEGIDKKVIEKCIREFCWRYLNTRFKRIHYLEPVNIEEAINSYIEHINSINGNIKIQFTDNLIEDMMKKLSKTKEEVIRILKHSIGK